MKASPDPAAIFLKEGPVQEWQGLLAHWKGKVLRMEEKMIFPKSQTPPQPGK
jgi:hypothetical protein